MSDSRCKIDDRGNKVWRNNKDQPHRIGGPAIEWADGGKSWWVNGIRHRIDGPAIEYYDGSEEWYVNGKKLKEQEFNEKMSYEKFKQELEELFTL
jgi:hypothetical protein